MGAERTEMEGEIAVSRSLSRSYVALRALDEAAVTTPRPPPVDTVTREGAGVNHR